MAGMGKEKGAAEAAGKEEKPVAGMTMPPPEGTAPQKKEETVKLQVDAAKLYACPMHPDFITTDPNANCPDCGMKVVPVKDLGNKVNLDKADFYTCAMHPEFLTTDPDGRCPECGMKVEKVKK